MEKMIMEKMNSIYENMAANTSMASMAGIGARGMAGIGACGMAGIGARGMAGIGARGMAGIGARGMAGMGTRGGPVRSNGGFSSGARESTVPYARTVDTTKKHYSW